MESYDEYARRAKLLADVHGLKGWSTPDLSEGKEDEEEDSKPAAAAAGSLPNALGKNGNKSNIVKSGGAKTLEKKMSKKKSLKRL